MRRLYPVLMALTLGGCDVQKPMSGEWEIASTMGSPKYPARTSAPTTYRRCVESRHQSAKAVILAMTSRDRCDDKDARIALGRIGGALHCPGSYDISDYDDRLAGTYSPNALRMTADMPLFGMPIRQTFEARRVGACAAGAIVIPKPKRPSRRHRVGD